MVSFDQRLTTTISQFSNLKVFLDFSLALSFHIAAILSNAFNNLQFVRRLHPILNDSSAS